MRVVVHRYSDGYTKPQEDGRKHLFQKGCIKNVTKHFFEWIITGVVFAVVASLLSTVLMAHIEENSRDRNQLNDLSNIYIGCSRAWMDEHFGVPQFVGHNDKYTLCAYILDSFAIQAAFDEAESAKAYLITVLASKDDSRKNKFSINDETSKYTKNLVLSDFSYYDFPGKPEAVFGATSNGNARAYYAEMYYFMSSGNYYEYYLATLDFGKLNNDFEGFLHEFGMPSGDIDDEVSAKVNQGVQVIVDRKKNCPNSYGVATLADLEAMDSLLLYWFNSQQLRNRLNTAEYP